jgi:hypothetical protein
MRRAREPDPRIARLKEAGEVWSARVIHQLSLRPFAQLESLHTQQNVGPGNRLSEWG